MTYAELVNLIKESHDSWTVSEGMEHLPESEQEKDFYLEGIEPVDGLDDETLMDMLGEEFNDGNWLVYEMKDGTICVEYTSQATANGIFMDGLNFWANHPESAEWVAQGWEHMNKFHPDAVARHQN